MQRKDKQKIVDEVWTEERIRSFLDLQPPAGMDADFHRLQRAYQSMRAEDFADSSSRCSWPRVGASTRAARKGRRCWMNWRVTATAKRSRRSSAASHP
jgi:hypothetical protein